MKPQCAWMTLGLLVASAAWAEQADVSPEAAHAIEMAHALVGGGDWSGAVNAYADYLGKLTTRDYRDKKTFHWILDEYEKQAPVTPPDYEPLKAVVKAKLPKYAREKTDPILTWRLYALLADIESRQGKDDEARQALDRAILAYPDVPYGEPSEQSLLQHLYNQEALLRAKADRPGAETYLIESFVKDPRFDFVYLPPWRKFFEDAGTPEQYAVFSKRVVEAYGRKAQRFPAKADMLTHYKGLLQQELPGASKDAEKKG